MSDFAGLAARDIRPVSNLDIYRDKAQNILHVSRYKPKYNNI